MNVTTTLLWFDQDGTLIAKRHIGESIEDFAELLTLLAEARDSARSRSR